MSRKRKHYSGVQMICPYFSREEDRAISCWSNNEQRVRLRMGFPSIEAKKTWARDHCESFRYWKCPLCEMIDEEEQAAENRNS